MDNSVDILYCILENYLAGIFNLHVGEYIVITVLGSVVAPEDPHAPHDAVVKPGLSVNSLTGILSYSVPKCTHDMAIE